MRARLFFLFCSGLLALGVSAGAWAKGKAAPEGVTAEAPKGKTAGAKKAYRPSPKSLTAADLAPAEVEVRPVETPTVEVLTMDGVAPAARNGGVQAMLDKERVRALVFDPEYRAWTIEHDKAGKQPPCRGLVVPEDNLDPLIACVKGYLESLHR